MERNFFGLAVVHPAMQKKMQRMKKSYFWGAGIG